jgi:hydroxymethylpyrimidine pyrophosphatase-like HAD family hydrolase
MRADFACYRGFRSSSDSRFSYRLQHPAANKRQTWNAVQLNVCPSIVIILLLLAKEDYLTSHIRLIVTCHASPSQAAPETREMSQKEQTAHLRRVAVVFSDIDGTLVHYNDKDSFLSSSLLNPAKGESTKASRSPSENPLIQLPLSASGLAGHISSRTLALCREVRSRKVKLILISGARASTLLQRIPYLPRADAYCCESGGRIFYPVAINPVNTNEQLSAKDYAPHEFVGSTVEDCAPFALVEDEQWRATVMSNPTPYNSLESIHPLWRYARELEKLGFILDRQSYETCFRVNRKHQPEHMIPVFERLQVLLQRNAGHEPFSSQSPDQFLQPPESISTSTNLGAIDFYPNVSGKKNW